MMVWPEAIGKESDRQRSSGTFVLVGLPLFFTRLFGHASFQLWPHSSWPIFIASFSPLSTFFIAFLFLFMMFNEVPLPLSPFSHHAALTLSRCWWCEHNWLDSVVPFVVNRNEESQFWFQWRISNNNGQSIMDIWFLSFSSDFLSPSWLSSLSQSSFLLSLWMLNELHTGTNVF